MEGNSKKKVIKLDIGKSFKPLFSPTSSAVADKSSSDEDEDDVNEASSSVRKVDTNQAEDATPPPPEAEIDLKTYFRLLVKSFCSPGNFLTLSVLMLRIART